MRKFLAMLGVLMTISGCGGSGDSDSGASGPIVGPAGILANIEVTNLNDFGVAGELTRWDYETEGLIPVKTNGVSIAVDAMDQIEAKLGLVIFDRTSIAGTPDNSITRGIIVSEGTAVGPGGVVDGNSCGHVSGAPGSTGFPGTGYFTTEGSINTKLYINLSSAGCTADTAIAIHEFGHALGMGTHFQGFGIGPAIDGNFWNVLYNIYLNNIGTLKQDLVITQIEF